MMFRIIIKETYKEVYNESIRQKYNLSKNCNILIGKKFEKLRVIDYDKKNKHNQIYWLCICDCKNIISVRSDSLTTGNTKSCGCSKIKVEIGDTFDRLTVVEYMGTKIRSGNKHIKLWKCSCSCSNNTIIVETSSLISGNTKSCGCLSREVIIKRNTTHNMSRSVEYIAWAGMKARCYNTKEESYKDYGGRGIKVCDRWLESFENFYEDMGPKPEPKNLYSIDRINVNGNYKPNNCKWATKFEQSINRRVRKSSKTGYTGIYKIKSGNYQAVIGAHGIIYYLGVYMEKKDAIAARKKAEYIHFNIS